MRRLLVIAAMFWVLHYGGYTFGPFETWGACFAYSQHYGIWGTCEAVL